MIQTIPHLLDGTTKEIANSANGDTLVTIQSQTGNTASLVIDHRIQSVRAASAEATAAKTPGVYYLKTGTERTFDISSGGIITAQITAADKTGLITVVKQ